MNRALYSPYLIHQCLILFLFFALQINSKELSAEEKSLAEEETGRAVEESSEKVSSKNREKIVSEQIESHLRRGKAHWLGNGDQRFLAVYTQYTPHKSREPEGAILLVHDLGANANWPQLIMPLRVQLAESGWNTLSIQSPMLAPGEEKKEFLRTSTIDTAIARISTAVSFLEEQESNRIVILGHGLGGATTTLYLTQNPQAPIAAFVGLSLGGATSLQYSRSATAKNATEELKQPEKLPSNQIQETTSTTEQVQKPEMPPNDAQPVTDQDFFAELQKLGLPFLDIFAEQDHTDVNRDAKKRAKLMRLADIQTYQQLQLDGADHYYIGHEARLIKKIHGWLRKYARP